LTACLRGVTGRAASTRPDAQTSVRSLTSVHVSSRFNRVCQISTVESLGATHKSQSDALKGDLTRRASVRSTHLRTPTANDQTRRSSLAPMRQVKSRDDPDHPNADQTCQVLVTERTTASGHHCVLSVACVTIRHPRPDIATMRQVTK
jgi:hypothetical protein